MSVPTACVLCGGDWGEAARAVASITRFGLPVAVGLTGPETGARPAGVAVVPVVWRDHFADARNQLLDRVSTEVVLWIDADEELVAYAEPDLANRPEPIFGVWIEDHPEETPRPIVRLHRASREIRWTGAVHELLSAPGEDDPPILDGILIRHHGYADPDTVAAKLARNHAIAMREAARGDTDYAIVLEHARWLAHLGGPSFTAWLEVFNHRDARPLRPGGYDRRVEAAERLCAMGYTTPAKLVLVDSPGIVTLRLALIAAEGREGGRVDAAAVAALARDLAGGRFDRRYAMPAALVDGDVDSLRRHVERELER